MTEDDETNSLFHGSWSFGGPYTGLYGGYANSVPSNYGLSHMADTEASEASKGASQEENDMELDPRIDPRLRKRQKPLKIAGQKIPGWEILGEENERSISSKHQSNLIYVLLGI